MNATTQPASSDLRKPEDQAWFRQVMGRYPTGVALVTATPAGAEPIAMVVGTFASASLDPPLVCFMPSKQSRRWAKLRPAGRFCVNIFAADQADLCQRLAAPGATGLEGVDWTPAPATGAPLIDDAVAFVDCALEMVHDAGDHDFALCRVLELGVLRDAPPLVFLGGAYGGFSPSED